MGIRSIELGRIDSPRVMDMAEAAYMAGFIDADGSLFIARAVMPRQRRPQFRAALSISNTNFEALAEMQRIMGVGALNCGYRSEANHKWKDKGQLNIRAGQLQFLLQQIAPHLIIKAEQAEVLQRFLDLKSQWSKANDNWTEQEALYSRCQILNGRGSVNQQAYTFKHPESQPKTCSEEGCDGVIEGHGLCRKHYRWAYESKRWEPGQKRECGICSTPLPETAPINQKHCGHKCRMKWYRRHGAHGQRKRLEGGT